MSVQKSELIAGPGAVLTCPKCHATIGTLQRPLYQGWHFGLDAISFEKDQVPDRKEPKAECRRCSAAYSETSQSTTRGRRMWIHTQQGWVPPPETVAGAVRGVIERVR